MSQTLLITSICVDTTVLVAGAEVLRQCRNFLGQSKHYLLISLFRISQLFTYISRLSHGTRSIALNSIKAVNPRTYDHIKYDKT